MGPSARRRSGPGPRRTPPHGAWRRPSRPPHQPRRRRTRSLLVDQDLQLAVLFLGLEHADGIDGRAADRLARRDVELTPVAGALDDRAVELALREGALHVGARVVERVEVALDVGDRHLALAHAERGHLPLGYRARRTDLHPLRHEHAPPPSGSPPGAGHPPGMALPQPTVPPLELIHAVARGCPGSGTR